MIVEMTKKYIRNVKYVMDPIWRGHAYFSSNRPNFSSNDFVHTGKFQMIKGIDLTAKTMKIVNNDLSSKFFILGDDMKKGLQSMKLYDETFICPGYKDPKEYFKKVKFYIQIARLEAGGTAVLEAMAAGVIPFVNETVGHSNIVAKVDKKLVVSSDPKKAAHQIIDFIKKTPRNKIIHLSKKCKEITKSNDLKNIIKKFDEALRELVKVSGRCTFIFQIKGSIIRDYYYFVFLFFYFSHKDGKEYWLNAR